MQPLKSPKAWKAIEYLFTDIDGTITTNGQIGPKAYEGLWRLSEHGIQVIPVTGRPAGWCEMIARTWPVAAVVGENGAFYFRYHKKKMQRHFALSETERKKAKTRLQKLEVKILKEVKGAKVSSDQFTRLFDLAIDFREDVKPLAKAKVQKIVELFEKAGATAKISNIHVNGWYGNYDKLSMCKAWAIRELKKPLSSLQNKIAFVGDSPNDEPMFQFFENSFAVSNVKEFLPLMEAHPKIISRLREGEGFADICSLIAKAKIKRN